MKSRFWKAVRTLVVICLIAGISFLTGAIVANENKPYRSAVALQKTGLPISYSQRYTLHGVTAGRDYFSQTVFQVEYSSERKELFNIMAHTKNWRIEKRRRELLIQFRDLLYSVASSVSVGRSMTQALEESLNFWNGMYDENDLIITDLLADVIVYPDGFVQVLDLDELCDAKEKGLITVDEFFLSIKQLGSLLDTIYSGHLEQFASSLLEEIQSDI